MSKREDYKRFIVFCLASLVVLAQAAVFAWVWYSVYRGQIDEPFWRKGNWVLIAIYGLMFALFAKLYGGLKVGYLKRIDVFYSLTLALLCTNVVEYLEITLINRWFLSVWPMIEMTGIQLVTLLMAGLFAAGGQFTITAAYTYAPAGKISIFDYSQIIFATLLGFFLFGEIPDCYSFIGYGLIILASLGMFVYNMKVIKCR